MWPKSTAAIVKQATITAIAIGRIGCWRSPPDAPEEVPYVPRSSAVRTSGVGIAMGRGVGVCTAEAEAVLGTRRDGAKLAADGWPNVFAADEVSVLYQIP